MKKVPAVSLLVLLAFFVPLYAQVSQSGSGQKSAMVVSVKKHMMPADFINDVIPHPQKYVYDVGIRLDCEFYVGRYESGVNQTPSMLDLNHMVKVQLNDGLMILTSPRGDQPVTTVVVSSEPASGCPVQQ